MNVTRAPHGSQPHRGQQSTDQQSTGQPHDGPGALAAGGEALEQVRARIRAAQGAAASARQVTARAEEVFADADLLRRRLPVITAAADRAMRSVRSLRGITPTSLWHAGRRSLAAERARRGEVLRTALAERDDLVARIADQDSRARDLRAESLRLRASASALPRLLDEAAASIRRTGGPAAEVLAVAEAGLEPVLRREADLDQAVRWVRWADLHLGTTLDRLGDGRIPGIDGRIPGDNGRAPAASPAGSPTARAGSDDARRVESARVVLAGGRDVLAVLVQALADLGVGSEPLTIPAIPVDLDPWFAGIATDARRRERVADALDGCRRTAGQLADLLLRVEGDHAATRRVLESRRAHWCALLRGE